MHLLLAPHGMCYLWQPVLVWGFAASDTVIAIAYFSISFDVWRSINNPPFPLAAIWQVVGYLFATFVLLCGITHATSVVEIWHPLYESHLVVAAATATISAVTSILFKPIAAKGKDFASLSIRDPLTGLYNRRFAEHELNREKERCDRYDQSMAIIMLDLDYLKQMNDSLGHDYGDEVLRKVAIALQENFRPYDMVARTGDKGDEMLALIPDTSAEVGLERANSMLEAIRALELRSPGSSTGFLTCSMGVAVYPQHGSTIKAVVKAADRALYQAKKLGRDRVVVAQ